MELADILPEESVVFCSDVATKHEVLEKLSEKIAKAAGRPVAEILAAIEAREALGSTGLGNGLAIPHGKLPSLGGVKAAFARLSAPVDFDAVDDQPVDLVVMLLAPLGAGADHLRALALVARLLRTESVVERLRTLTGASDLYDVLTQPFATHQAA